MEKSNELSLGRYTIFVLSIGVAIYVATGFIYNIVAPVSEGSKVSWGHVSGVLVGLVLVGVGYFYSIVHPKAVRFINETESELRKVVWPKATPFAAKTELWQYVIAVIMMIVVLVVFIGVVDVLLGYVIKELILK